jgi:hypothetical protein
MKHPVILDACTIINLLRVDEEDEFLFKLITSLDLYIANIVYREVNKNVNKNPLTEAQRNYITQVLPLINTVSDHEIIKNISQEYFDQLCKFTNHTKKHNGELYSSALSLYISREKNSRVYFYTDDFPARKQFSPYFSYQQIGVIGDSIDLLLFLYWTKSNFDEKRLKKYLADLKSEYNIPLKQLVDKIQAKKDLFSNKDKKDKNLMENVDKILNGYLKSDSQSINEGIVFFSSNNKYPVIKRIITLFPDIDKECVLFQKVRNTMQSLSSYSVFKVNGTL